MPQIPELNELVFHFKQWAATLIKRSGEWECDYEHWDELYSAAQNAIALHESGSIPITTANDLLYVLARDNEAETIRECLMETPALLASLARHAMTSGEADAKWQLAVSIAEIKLPDAASLIRPFLTDDAEYVRRRSLLAIAPFAPREAEAMAIKNLDDVEEYTRIMALHVLHTIKSDQLDVSLERLASDSNEYVRKNVEQLRVAQNGT